MESLLYMPVIAASFVIIALSSKQIGQFFSTTRLPLISGFHFAGIIAGPSIYIAFFRLTGASPALDILSKTWPIALILFLVRLAAILV